MKPRILLVGFWLLAAFLFLSACKWSGNVGVPTATAVVQVSPTAIPVATATTVPAAPEIVPSATPVATLPTALKTATASVPSLTPTGTSGPGVPVTILDIHMLNRSAGWAVGSNHDLHQAILRTSDGGVSWKVFSPPEAKTENLKAVAYFLDEKTAWVTYADDPGLPSAQPPKVWRTHDGGVSWLSSELDVNGVTAQFFIPGQIGFSDSAHGWLIMHLGAGMMHDYVAIYTSANAGESWTRVIDPSTGNLPMSCYKNGAWFRDAAHGYVAGSCAGVQAGLFFYQTSDSGTTWEEVHLPDPSGGRGMYAREGLNNEADGLVFLSPDQGRVIVASMDSIQAQGQRWVYTTNDGGKSWSSQALPGYWGESFFLDSRFGWVLIRKDREAEIGTQVMKTVDGGMSWKMLGTVNWQGTVQFVDGLTGWVIAHSSDAQDLVVTHNGGVRWELLKTVVIP